MNKIIKEAFVLFAITVIAGLLLGVVYKITKEPIANQVVKTKLAAYQSVFSELDSTEEIEASDIENINLKISESGLKGVTINEMVSVFDKDKKYLGVIVTVTDANGYGGNMKLSVGIDKTGTITGIEFLELNETAGLGMKAKESSFKNQFKGIKADEVKHTKSGKTAPNEFDAISSATITSKAVEDAVNGALKALKYQEVTG